MFFCELFNIFQNIFWQNTSGWLLLSLRNCLFHVQVAEFQPGDTVKKNIFQRCFWSIFHKNEKWPFEDIHLLKILENYL